MTLQLVMSQKCGEQRSLFQATGSARGSVIVVPSSGSHAVTNSSFAAHKDMPSSQLAQAQVIAPRVRYSDEEVKRLESSWLDLTADIANFMELDPMTEMVGEEQVEELVAVSSPLTSSIAMETDPKYGEYDLDKTEMAMNANIKILENFIMDSLSTEDSLDSIGSDINSNQSLIEEVESFLLATTGGQPTIVTREDEEEVPIQESVDLSDSNVLKALASGRVWTEDERKSGSKDTGLNLTEEDLASAFTTTIKTETGQEVIIIIAQPGSMVGLGAGDFSPLPASPGPESRSSYVGSPEYSTSDYDWSPSPAQQQQQRKKYQRKNRPTLTLEPYPRDKTERKKAQNRTAAFRYREKKKAELDAVDSEVEQLIAKNASLKARLRDMEQEYRCLRRLMLETGLGHLLVEAV